MIRNYLKIAWRNLGRHRMNAFINAWGLSSAFTFIVLIAAFIWQEAHIDASIKNIDRQYLVQSDLNGLTSVGMLSRSLYEQYPNKVEDYFRFDGISVILSQDDRNFQQSAIIADSSFFRMFGFTLATGDENTALLEPKQVVLTYEAAIRLFGTPEAVGKQVDVANFAGEKHPFTVSGVLEKLPKNSVTHLIADDPTDVIFPISSAPYFGRQVDTWDNPYIASYITLKPGVEPEQLVAPIERLLADHLPAERQQAMKTRLNPLSTYHLMKGNGTVKRMLYTLSIVGGFILLMACINFVNISINTAAGRLREIGVRKVIGGTLWQLRIQFLSEALLIVTLSSLFAMACYPLLSGVASGIFGKALPRFGELGRYFWTAALSGFLAIGILAAGYPAFRLSAYRAINALKGKLPASLERTFVRKGLVGLQFTVAFVVLIATAVIASQMDVFFGTNLGYDKNNLVTAQVPRDWSPEGLQKTERIRDRLALLPEVESITLSYDIPGAMSSGSAQLRGSASAESTISASLIFSDRHFAETYKIPLLAGTFFSNEERSESSDRVVINEAFANALGYDKPVKALNQPIYFDGSETPLLISGVSRDFYGHTMHTPVGPSVWLNINSSNVYRYFTVRLKPGDAGPSLRRLEQEWKSLMPDAPFDYSFVDERLNVLYQTERRLQQASTASAILAVFIVLLGMVGLIAQNLARRTKEIGIRKVLGASVKQVVALFMKDLSMVFLAAAAIAVPVAYLLMHRWLEAYHNKATLDLSNMGLPIAAMAFLTALLIVAQTIRIAMAKPVDSLRDE